MEREYVIAKLREHEPELRASGVLQLSLFGSAARGDASFQSDVALMVEFNREKRLSLLGRIRLQNRMTDILGVAVDVADRKMLRPEVLEMTQQESILVF